jgi:hypothetical protein
MGVVVWYVLCHMLINTHLHSIEAESLQVVPSVPQSRTKNGFSASIVLKLRGDTYRTTQQEVEIVLFLSSIPTSHHNNPLPF